MQKKVFKDLGVLFSSNYHRIEEKAPPGKLHRETGTLFCIFEYYYFEILEYNNIIKLLSQVPEYKRFYTA